MLLSFTFENWKSFRDETRFSMVAGKERLYTKRLPRVERFGVRLLPISVVYGGNAAGKSNFFEALDFAKNFIVDGNKLDEPIPVQPFRLVAKSEQVPSKFSFQILCNERVFRFSFTVTRQSVLEEELTEVKKAGEKVLYIRSKDGQIRIEKSTNDDIADEQFLEFVKRATPTNQLFITRSVSLNFDKFRPVFDWFRNELELVPSTPDAIVSQGSTANSPSIQESAKRIMPQLDTGIDKIGFKKVSIRDLGFPDQLIGDIDKNLKNENSTAFIQIRGRNRANYSVERKKGKLIVYQWITYHKGRDGEEFKFDMDEESAGTKRLFDLLPALSLIFSAGSKKVYVFDEFDQSLHTSLTRELIENYLLLCDEQTRCQLVFTTHNLLLMTKYIFRRDEMWLAERDGEGASSMFSMYEFKKTGSKNDLYRAYVAGRFGGGPKLSLNVFNFGKGDAPNE